jgi:ribonuclease III
VLTPDAWAAARLGYRFADPAVLAAALTHRSAGRTNYERLEFLGDAVLTLVVSELLYREFAEADEGDLSRYRATLVSGSMLAEIATALGLGEQLRLGGGELKSGGFRRGSILADALEGVIGAVYLDGAFDGARDVVMRLYAGRLQSLPIAHDLKDAKTRLQEELQRRGLALPAYMVEGVSGEPHEQRFVVACEVPALGLRTLGEGTSRRRAEQAAAQRLLESLAGRAAP